MYISAWNIHTGSIGAAVAKAHKAGKIKDSDIVWRGPSGDVYVAATAADVPEDGADYVDAGQVSEYLD